MLPVPGFWNRLDAPLWVFNFGIVWDVLGIYYFVRIPHWSGAGLRPAIFGAFTSGSGARRVIRRIRRLGRRIPATAPGLPSHPHPAGCDLTRKLRAHESPAPPGIRSKPYGIRPRSTVSLFASTAAPNRMARRSLPRGPARLWRTRGPLE